MQQVPIKCWLYLPLLALDNLQNSWLRNGNRERSQLMLQLCTHSRALYTWPRYRYIKQNGDKCACETKNALSTHKHAYTNTHTYTHAHAVVVGGLVLLELVSVSVAAPFYRFYLFFCWLRLFSLFLRVVRACAKNSFNTFLTTAF